MTTTDNYIQNLIVGYLCNELTVEQENCTRGFQLHQRMKSILILGKKFGFHPIKNH